MEKGEDWSSFNGEKEEQFWFFEEIYNSLIESQDKEHPLFRMLREKINELKRICRFNFENNYKTPNI